MVVCAAMNIRIDTTHLVGILIGCLFIAIGNVFGKLRWNGRRCRADSSAAGCADLYALVAGAAVKEGSASF
jgi:hypothetical protein